MVKCALGVRETASLMPNINPACHLSDVGEWEPVYTVVRLCVNPKEEAVPSPAFRQGKGSLRIALTAVDQFDLKPMTQNNYDKVVNKIVDSTILIAEE